MGVNVLAAQEGRAADEHVLTVDSGADTATRVGGEIAGRRHRASRLAGSIDHRPGEGVFGAGFHSRGKQQCPGILVAVDALLVDQAGAALSEGTGLVDDEGVDLLQSFEGLGVLDQHALAGAAPDPDHDRHWRGQTQRTRAGDDQHADGGHDRERQPRLRPDRQPQPEGGQGDGDHDRYEHRRDLVDQSLDRSTGPLRLGDQVDDPGQGRVGAQASGLHHQAAALDDRAADNPVTGALVDRNRLAGNHRLVHIRVTIDHGAVGRHLLARPHPAPIAQLQLGGRNVGLGAVGPDAVRGGR